MRLVNAMDEEQKRYVNIKYLSNYTINFHKYTQYVFCYNATPRFSFDFYFH